ncbi:MAG TPA: NAD(P)-binding domain-containing protein [Acidimicrobiales bacterium]|nr:NAD(P)-binding domain-containing protein [Acidimicrobiales bacterium]
MRTTTAVVGGGQSGLAVSACLSARSIDHVVFERHEVASSWRRERWDSLRLLTPNWQCRLPGLAYQGDDPDGYMSALEVAEFIGEYAKLVGAPVLSGTTVEAVRPVCDGYVVRTDQGEWECPTVVLASGAFGLPKVPACATAVPAGVATLTAMDYRNPDQLGEGGVMVVGASATGVQIAAELRRSGRDVIIAVGEHVRGPRMYRGRDIHWWMEAARVLDERYDEVDDIVRARRVPSMQLGGSDDRATFDLNALSALGVKLVGRLAGINDGRAQFSGSLRNKCELADLKLGRLLDTIDEWAAAEGLDGSVPAPHRFEPTVVDPSPRLLLDLRSGEVETIVWATGYRPDYSWLEVDVLDAKGMVRHDGGVSDALGLFLIGTPFLRRRKSSFIDGARVDAEDVVGELSAYLDRRASARD